MIVDLQRWLIQSAGLMIRIPNLVVANYNHEFHNFSNSELSMLSRQQKQALNFSARKLQHFHSKLALLIANYYAR